MFKKLESNTIVWWVVAVFVFSVILGTYLTSSDSPANALSINNSRATPNMRCDSQRWTRYLGMNGEPIYARMEVQARVCWKTFDSKNNPGGIVRKKSRFNVAFYNTALGATMGTRWNHSWKYRIQGSNRWIEIIGRHSWWRNCINVLGQSICGPAGDFVPYVRFYSPYITEPRMHNGIKKNWKLFFHEGEPGKAAGNYDRTIYISKTI